MKRVRVKIFGIVQGVGFRNFVRFHAKKMNLNGYVRNLEDGSVEAVFEGVDELVDRIIEFCRKGPPLARVSDVKIVNEDFKNEFNDFKILY